MLRFGPDPASKQQQQQQQRISAAAADGAVVDDSKHDKPKASEFAEIYVGKINSCGKNSCVYNDSNTCYVHDASISEEHLKPYKFPKHQCEQEESWFTVNILSSVVVDAWKQIVIIYILCVCTSLILVFDLIPAAAYPIDSFAFGHIFGIFSLSVAIYYDIMLSGIRTIAQEYSAGVLGSCVSAASNSATVIYNKKTITKNLRAYRYNHTGTDFELDSRKVVCFINDINFILKSIPYAVRHTFRNRGRLDVYRLPMPTSLGDELQFGIRAGMGPLAQLLFMFEQRVTTLGENQILPDITVSPLLAYSSAIRHSIDTIEYLLGGGGSIPRSLYNFTQVSLWIYCIFITFPLYGYFALDLSLWVYYPVLLLIVTALLSAFRVIVTRANPFDNFWKFYQGRSNYVALDLRKLTDTKIATIDATFEITIRQLIQVSLDESASGNGNISNPAPTDVAPISMAFAPDPLLAPFKVRSQLT